MGELGPHAKAGLPAQGRRRAQDAALAQPDAEHPDSAHGAGADPETPPSAAAATAVEQGILGEGHMRIAGQNVVAILVAGVVFWLIGALWFGLLFSAQFQAGVGFTTELAAAETPAWYALGAAISFITAVGLSVVLRWGGLPSVGGALRRTFWLWVGFGLTSALYGLAYWPQHSLTLMMIMSSYFLVGWLAAAVVIAVMK